MQNHLGMVKVGRSGSVEARRRAIEKAHGCSVALIAVVQDGGDQEQLIHAALDEYRLLGEWFDGTKDALRAIADAFSPSLQLEWRFPIGKDDEIETWLNTLSELKHLRARDQEVQKLIRDMTRGNAFGDERNSWIDSRIYTVFWRFILTNNAGIDIVTNGTGSTTFIGLREVASGEWIEEPVPSFSNNCEAALSLWPADVRPTVWQGSAWDCCLAALQAQKGRLTPGASRGLPHWAVER